MEKVERKTGVLDDANKYAGEVDVEWVHAEDYDAIAAKLDAVRETLNTPSVMDIGFLLDKLREIVK